MKNSKNMSEKQDGARTILQYGEGEAQFLEPIFAVFTVKPAESKRDCVPIGLGFVLRFILSWVLYQQQ